jgi:hypothetical protein
MKVMIAFRHAGFARHFIQLIEKMAKEGDEVHLAVFNSSMGPKGEGYMYDSILRNFANEYTNIHYLHLTKRHVQCFWTPVSFMLRGFIDYYRYLDKHYDDYQGKHLQARSEKYIRGFTLILTKYLLPWRFLRLFGRNFFRWMYNLLSFLDSRLPVSSKLKLAMLDRDLDLVLVSPMVNYGCPTNEVIKAANMLGINNGLLVASWDNLTNKGLIKCQPQKVYLWNKYQKEEAVTLHLVNPESVEVMGAPTFDDWFSKKPLNTKVEFQQSVGLNEENPYILYLCSSKSIAPKERLFFEEWIANLRKLDDKFFQEVGVLVRPHPKNEEQWQDFDESQYENVVIYPRNREINIGLAKTKDVFYESMLYSDIVVGINTTAMIEAGILEKPVFTIVPQNDRFGIHEGTYGTLHFNYLRNAGDGGLIQYSETYDDHLNQLEEFFRLNDKQRAGQIEKIKNYIKEFVRPNGLTENVTQIYYNRIKEQATVEMPSKDYSLTLSSQIVRLLMLIFKFKINFDSKAKHVNVQLPLGIPEFFTKKYLKSFVSKHKTVLRFLTWSRFLFKSKDKRLKRS